jgi:membrane protein
MGASLAFYTMLSIAPLLLLVIAIAGLLFDPAAVRGNITDQLGSLIGRETGIALERMMESASQRRGGGIAASIIGFLTLLFGASSVALDLRNSLNKIFPACERFEGFVGIVKERSYAIAAVMGAGFLLLVSLIFSAAVSAAGTYMQQILPLPAMVFELINFVASLTIFTGVLAAIFKMLPTNSPTWREVFLGSLVTALLFTVGKTLIGLYIGTAAIGSTYGAAGSFVVLLFWVYYSTQILFFGAAFIKVHANSRVTRFVPAYHEPPPPEPKLLTAGPQPNLGLTVRLARLAGSVVTMGQEAKALFTKPSHGG